MSAGLQVAFDPGALATWLPVAVGVGTAVAFVIGYLIARLRNRPSEPPAGPMEGLPGHDPFVAGSFTERRISPRRKGHSIAVWISDETAEARPISGLVADRSVEGLGLAVPQSFEVGTILSVRPAGAPPSAGWVQVEVKNSRQTASGWEVGCRFLHTPPWNTRMLFG
jgi:hypothetical protein